MGVAALGSLLAEENVTVRCPPLATDAFVVGLSHC